MIQCTAFRELGEPSKMAKVELRSSIRNFRSIKPRRSPGIPNHAHLHFCSSCCCPCSCGRSGLGRRRSTAFDIVKNCKAEAAGAGTGVEAYTGDETNAKDELAKRWSSYDASAKKDCIGESSIGGDKSYVELLTCLEMTTGKFGPREDQKQ